MQLESYLPDAIRRSYLRKFTLIVAVVAVVFGAFGFYAQATTADAVREQRQTELQELATQEANVLEEYYDKQRDRVGLLSENDDFESDTMSGIRDSLNSQRERFGDNVYAIHYVDTGRQRIVESTRHTERGRLLTAPGMTWKNDLQFEDPNAIDQSEVYRHNGTEQVAFASPVEGTEALIVLSVDVARVGAEFSNSIRGGTTRAANADGIVAISPNGSNVLREYQTGSDATAVQQGASGGSGTYQQGDELISYAPVEETDLVIIKHAPVANAYAVADQVQQNVIGLVVAALLGFALVGVVIRRGTITTLEGLTDATSAVAAGNLSAETEETERTDEIGDLQNGFADVNDYLETVVGQADALADQRFDAAVLNQDVPGDLGQSLETMGSDLEEFITEVEQARDNAWESQEEAEALATTLRQQAEQFSVTMEQAADGDLTQRLDTDIDNDAMQSIAEATNTMLTHLEQTVVEIQEFAQQVNGTADQVIVSAEEVRNASEEVSRSVQGIASGAERQNQNIQKISGEMSDLSATVEEIASSSNEVAQKSSQATETGANGQKRATAAIEVMNEVET